MKMNLYMEISVILVLILAFSAAYSLLKDTHRKHLRIVSISCISGISLMIIWRAVHLAAYFN